MTTSNSSSDSKKYLIFLLIGACLGFCLGFLIFSPNSQQPSSSSFISQNSNCDCSSSSLGLKQEQIASSTTTTIKLPLGSKLLKVAQEIQRKFGTLALTDKIARIHDYAPMYEKILEPYVVTKKSNNNNEKEKEEVAKPFSLFEVGLGCAVDSKFIPAGAGAGFRLFKTYAPNVNYYGLDIMKCNFKHLGEEMNEWMTKHHVKGSQVDPVALDEAMDRFGPQFDIVIDDGSHQSQHIIDTFIYLFPRAVKNGGVYCVEDLFVAYHPWFAHHPLSAQVNRTTSVNMIQDLIASLQFPFDRFSKQSGRSFIHPDAQFKITGIARMIQSIDCSREICCFHKMDTENGLHKWPIGTCNYDLNVNNRLKNEIIKRRRKKQAENNSSKKDADNNSNDPSDWRELFDQPWCSLHPRYVKKFKNL